MARKREAPQATFGFMRRGGKRRGAGRKPKVPGRPGVAHAARPRLTGREPVHVTLHVCDDVPNLRRNGFLVPILDVLRKSSKDGFRLCQFAVLGNHVHLIVEADSAEKLARGMQGLSVRLARWVNRAVGRRGRFFGDRYHAHVLRSPTEVHRALAYVLLNQRRHEAQRLSYRPEPAVDAFSSGAWFDGWTVTPWNAAGLRRSHAPPVAEPSTWLLAKGWRRLGAIRPSV
jgi:REP element-mobilizing transposase RayT